MSTHSRYLLLLLLSPSLAFAHGTEFAGMFLGTCASAIVTTIGVSIFPLRPRRRIAVFASYAVAAVGTCVGIATLQDGINKTYNYSVWPWIVFSALPPLVVVGIIYHEFCRPEARDRDGGIKKDP